jgi:ribose 5-phosphate isomerase B
VKIGISSDHGGFTLKEAVKKHFSTVEFDDVGTFTEDSCDYPDYVAALCRKIQQGELEYGIVICGTGIGASIAANKMKGIRAALCCNEFMAEMAKRHNNANVLSLGARVIGEELAMRIVDRWLTTAFEGGRHQRRIEKINELEKTC